MGGLYSMAPVYKYKGVGNWAVECSAVLNLGEERFKGKAALLHKDKCKGVQDAVKMLNEPGESFACVEGYCVVFSERTGRYYLLYTKDKKDEALAKFDLE